MGYDPNIIHEESWLSIIAFVAMEVIADELGTPDDEGGPLHRSRILIRPEPIHQFATNVYALEFVIPAHHYPSRTEDSDKLAEKIGARIARALVDRFDGLGATRALYAAGPMRCFVQLQFCEIGHAPFTISVEDPDYGGASCRYAG